MVWLGVPEPHRAEGVLCYFSVFFQPVEEGAEGIKVVAYVLFAQRSWLSFVRTGLGVVVKALDLLRCYLVDFFFCVFDEAFYAVREHGTAAFAVAKVLQVAFKAAYQYGGFVFFFIHFFGFSGTLALTLSFSFTLAFQAVWNAIA